MAPDMVANDVRAHLVLMAHTTAMPEAWARRKITTAFQSALHRMGDSAIGFVGELLAEKRETFGPRDIIGSSNSVYYKIISGTLEVFRTPSLPREAGQKLEQLFTREARFFRGRIAALRGKGIPVEQTPNPPGHTLSEWIKAYKHLAVTGFVDTDEMSEGLDLIIPLVRHKEESVRRHSLECLETLLADDRCRHCVAKLPRGLLDRHLAALLPSRPVTYEVASAADCLVKSGRLGKKAIEELPGWLSAVINDPKFTKGSNSNIVRHTIERATETLRRLTPSPSTPPRRGS